MVLPPSEMYVSASSSPRDYRIALIIPTHNALRHWESLLDGIRIQTLVPNQVIVIDSSSTDGTVDRARDADFTVLEIDRREFNHGGTRQLAAEHAQDADILIYLTQDAIPCRTDAFENIVAAFEDPAIGAAFGRQLPRPGAGSIEAHARLFNYPPVSRVRGWEDRQTMGFKSIFFSNSFGAYRLDALISVGGFSSDVIFGEDTLAVARMHRAGWKTAYVHDAVVEHSHSFSMTEEFKRYFDIGVLHARESWLIEHFGTASGEGWRFAKSELSYLIENDVFSIPSALVHTAAKYLGYKIGKHEKRIATDLKYHLGLNKDYWVRGPGITKSH